jgi:hydroxymethylglutaryl-CoA lyase
MPSTEPEGENWAKDQSDDDWVTIREVGPRDGLQVEAPMPVEARVALVESLVATGIACVEAAAFVSPERVPAMAEAGAVVSALTGLPATCFVLVPNLRGAQMAVDAGARAVTVTVSASEAYSVSNVGRGRDEASDEVGRIVAFLAGPSLPVDVVVSCAFGYAGREEPDFDWIDRQTRHWAAAGPCSLTLADTTGEAGPAAIAAAIGRFGPDFGLHLHETRRSSLANAYAALVAGLRRFDTSVAGLGGSPFAEGAAGNLATEELVHLLGSAGYRCGIDLHALLEVSRSVSGTLGRPTGALAGAGPAGSYRGQ